MNDAVSATVGVDGHCDTLGELVEHGGYLRDPRPDHHADAARLREGGVDLQVFACCPVFSAVKIALDGRPGAHSVFNMIDRLMADAEGPEAAVRAIRTKRDLDALCEWVRAGRPAGRPRLHGVLGVEGGEALEGDLVYLRSFFRLGVRLLGLTHNRRNALADGIEEGETASGLSSFGREVVAECQRLGIVVDVSHLAPAGFWDVIQLARGGGFPVVASHSNARALCPHPPADAPGFLQYRSLTDEQAKAIAETGGLVGVTFVSSFLRWDRRATLADVLDHLEHFLALLGPDHVAIGSDFDGTRLLPVGLEDAARRPAIAAGLRERGYDETVISKVMGENWVRVFRAVFPE